MSEHPLTISEQSEHASGSPSRTSLDRGELVDLPELPVDVRAARAWHRAMVNRNTARNDYAANLRMYVRFAVTEGNLDEARQRLAALLAYADYGVDPTEPPYNPIPDVTSDWKLIRRLTEAMFTSVDEAVNTLIDEGYVDPDDEDLHSLVADRLFDLAIGKE